VSDPFAELTLVLGRRPIVGAWDRLRRYCGLAWSGGPPETWAYCYYDDVDTEGGDLVSPTDVLAAAALHPGLSRTDLAYFHDERQRLADWLSDVPNDVELSDAGDGLLEHLQSPATWAAPVSLSLLSKVLHRKRPRLVPIVDRALLDWYRPVTGQRTATAAWGALLENLRADLGGENALMLEMLGVRLSSELGRKLTRLRLADITVWMGSRA
jgi:hypothetical protein